MANLTDDELHRIADARWATLRASGVAVSWDDADVRARIRGEQPPRPPARHIRR